ncbi:DDE-type integrase/transposase/recombinase [Thermophilibacter sp.]
MSKKRRILLMLAKGRVPQSEVAAALHASKRDVSACAKAIKERGLAFDGIAAMGEAEVDAMLAPPREPAESAYLAPDMGPLIERKRRNRKLTVKMFWMEHCVAAEAAGKRAYSYQTFCEMFADAAERAGAVRRLAHEPGAKAYIDWAGDTAWLTDRLTGARTKVYVIVVALPYSDRFWAQGFTDMRQRSWQEGQARAFQDFGGVPRMLVPDNAATATDRSSVYVTLINAEYRRFAEHYGAAVVPARVRRPGTRRSPSRRSTSSRGGSSPPRTSRHSTRSRSSTGSAWGACGGWTPARSRRRMARATRSTRPWSGRACSRCPPSGTRCASGAAARSRPTTTSPSTTCATPSPSA